MFHTRELTAPTIIAIMTIVMILISAKSDIHASSADTTSRKVTILFTGDDYGNVKSCGCDYTGDTGGIHRRATFIRHERETNRDVVLIDTGDMLSGSGRLLDIKSEVYAKAIPLMDYDAVGLGDNEVIYIRQNQNRKFLREYALCVNLIDSKSGLPVTQKEYAIKTTGSGVRVGIISIIGDDIINPETQEKLGIRVVSPLDALRPILAKMKDKTDILVLASHTGINAARKLAQSLPEINVIITGHPPLSSLDKAEVIGNTILVQSFPGGKRIGRLALEIDRSNGIRKQKCDYISLSADIPEDPAVSELVEKHDKEIEEYYTEKWKLDDPVNSPVNISTLKYASSASCKDCHKVEYKTWVKTPHAAAYESLKKDGRFDNIECASCHTTGAGAINGFRSNESTPELAGVQCESCHGAGESHISSPGKGYGIISETTCIQCHDPAHSPDFKFAKYVKHVVHRKTRR